MVCKLSVMTCQTPINLLDNIYIIFLQHLCKNFGVQGSNLRIPRTEPAGPVLQGPVQGSAVCLNQTISLVQGSGKVSFELDQTGPRHHYLLQLDSVAQTKAHPLFKGYETCRAIKDTQFGIEMSSKCKNTYVRESGK